MEMERISSTQFIFVLHVFSILVCSTVEGNNLSVFISPESTEAAMNLSQGTWAIFKSLANARKGDNLRGITELKQYFLNFGYLNPQKKNITDFYDERLEAAVKLYQLNFGLPPTGHLDNKTLSQIMIPRCGIADTVMINNSSMHKVGHYSFFQNRQKWPAWKQNLTYAFSPENKQPGMNETRLKILFSRAFSRWATVIPLTFKLSHDYYSADIRIGFFSGDHGDGKPFDGVLKNLAHGFCPEDGRLHFDAAESWSLDLAEDDSSDRAIDLESIAMHEIGHVLGLGHTYVNGAIMYPSIRPRTRRVFLARDDVQGAQALYGANPRYDPSMVSLTTSDEYIESSGIHKPFYRYEVFVTSLLCLISWGWILWL